MTKFTNPKDVGAQLRGARQKKGLTIENTYKTTHIQPKTIEALEEGIADEILERIYLLLFLKKYANFLGLDGEGIASQYKRFEEDKTGGVEDLRKPKREQEVRPSLLSHVKPEIIAAGLFLLLYFIFLFGVKARIPGRPEKASVPDLKDALTTLVVTAKPIAKHIQEPEPSAEVKRPVAPPSHAKPIDLALKSDDDVWMKVKRDGKVVFEGIVGKNQSKSWAADNAIDLWVGRAEALDFTINGKFVGKIGAGRIKGIVLTRSGLKVEDKWLLKSSE
ncbi:MAG: RodZ domain-containing protein [Candidatus Omnitrophota bacterium]